MKIQIETEKLQQGNENLKEMTLSLKNNQKKLSNYAKDLLKAVELLDVEELTNPKEPSCDFPPLQDRLLRISLRAVMFYDYCAEFKNLADSKDINIWDLACKYVDKYSEVQKEEFTLKVMEYVHFLGNNKLEINH